MTFLLDTALDGSSVVFLPWSAGVMTHFERDFYAGKISDGALNAAWWALVGQYQGIAPPGERPETLCDAATKTHINDDPAQYYDYAIGTVIKFQLHDHIAREILKQDPRECNYYGNKRVGDFLRGILAAGATKDWNAVLREATGEGVSARALVAYLRRWPSGSSTRTGDALEFSGFGRVLREDRGGRARLFDAHRTPYEPPSRLLVHPLNQ